MSLVSFADLTKEAWLVSLHLDYFTFSFSASHLLLRYVYHVFLRTTGKSVTSKITNTDWECIQWNMIYAHIMWAARVCGRLIPSQQTANWYMFEKFRARKRIFRRRYAFSCRLCASRQVWQSEVFLIWLYRCGTPNSVSTCSIIIILWACIIVYRREYFANTNKQNQMNPLVYNKYISQSHTAYLCMSMRMARTRQPIFII